jgi:hypothetical protein
MWMTSIIQSCGDEASFAELPTVTQGGSHLVPIRSALGFAGFSPIDRTEGGHERIR